MMKVPEIIVSLNRKTKEIKTTYDFFFGKIRERKVYRSRFNVPQVHVVSLHLSEQLHV